MKIKLHIILLGFFLIVGCSTAEYVKGNSKSDLIVNRNNYYDYFTSESGLHTGSLDDDEILDLILTRLEKEGFTISRTSLYKLDNGTFIPLSGYLVKEKIGFFIESVVSYPKKKKDRINKSTQYITFSNDIPSIRYFKNNLDNIIVFKTNWYWYQDWTSKYDKKRNRNLILVSKKKVYEILNEDINDLVKEINKKP